MGHFLPRTEPGRAGITFTRPASIELTRVGRVSLIRMGRPRPNRSTGISHPGLPTWCYPGGPDPLTRHWPNSQTRVGRLSTRPRILHYRVWVYRHQPTPASTYPARPASQHLNSARSPLQDHCRAEFSHRVAPGVAVKVASSLGGRFTCSQVGSTGFQYQRPDQERGSWIDRSPGRRRVDVYWSRVDRSRHPGLLRVNRRI